MSIALPHVEPSVAHFAESVFPNVRTTEDILKIISELGEIEMCVSVDQHPIILGGFGETPNFYWQRFRIEAT